MSSSSEQPRALRDGTVRAWFAQAQVRDGTVRARLAQAQVRDGTVRAQVRDSAVRAWLAQVKKSCPGSSSCLVL